MSKTREIDEVTPDFASLFTPEVVANMKKKFGPDFLNFDESTKQFDGADVKESHDETQNFLNEEQESICSNLKNMYTTGLSPSGRKMTKSELFNIKLDYERRTGEKLEWIYG